MKTKKRGRKGKPDPAILADIVPARERAKYQGYFLAVFGTSSVLGPVIGGFLAGLAVMYTTGLLAA
jgi:MFS family permease